MEYTKKMQEAKDVSGRVAACEFRLDGGVSKAERCGAKARRYEKPTAKN
jgi:hypothetical protein